MKIRKAKKIVVAPFRNGLVHRRRTVIQAALRVRQYHTRDKGIEGGTLNDLFACQAAQYWIEQSGDKSLRFPSAYCKAKRIELFEELITLLTSMSQETKPTEPPSLSYEEMCRQMVSGFAQDKEAIELTLRKGMTGLEVCRTLADVVEEAPLHGFPWEPTPETRALWLADARAGKFVPQINAILGYQ